MKKLSILCLALCSSLLGFSQILTEDFELGLPDTWTAENAWEHGNVNNLSSTAFIIPDHSKFMAVNDDLPGASGNSSGKLITPVLDFTNIDESYALSFEGYFLNSDYQGTDETAKVFGSSDGGQNWIEMYDMTADFEWQIINVSVGDLAGKTNVMFAFDYDDGGGWNYGFAIDDVRLRQVFQKDLAIQFLEVQKYVPNIGDVPISFRVINNGIEQVNTFDVNIQIAGNDYLINQSVPPLGYLDSIDLQVYVPFDISVADLYEFEFGVINVNGALDENPVDNVGFLQLSSVSNPPIKRTVAEEGTGTWCGWCPRGAVNLEYMKSKYHDEFIGIAVHNNDVMTLSQYDGPLPVNSFPGLLIDRASLIDPGEVESNFLENQKNITPLGVSFERSYDASSRNATVDFEITVHTKLKGDYRYALIITEDFVTGPSPEYDQANYYSNNVDLVDIHGVNWKDLPDPVRGPDLYYHEVARAIVGGYEGEPGSIGAELSDGQMIEGQINYNLPVSYDENNINLVLAIIDAENGEILNGFMRRLVKTTGIYEPPSQISGLTIYPNPSNDKIEVNFDVNEISDVDLELFTSQSILITKNTYKKVIGNQSIKLFKEELPSGVYYLKIKIEDRFIMKKVIFTE